jgi:hypothetical protein
MHTLPALILISLTASCAASDPPGDESPLIRHSLSRTIETLSFYRRMRERAKRNSLEEYLATRGEQLWAPETASPRTTAARDLPVDQLHAQQEFHQLREHQVQQSQAFQQQIKRVQRQLEYHENLNDHLMRESSKKVFEQRIQSSFRKGELDVWRQRLAASAR